MNNAFEKRINRFKRDCNMENLHKTLDITHAKLSFQFINLNDINTLTIQYNKYDDAKTILFILINQFDYRIPPELTKMIVSYLFSHKYIHIGLNLNLRTNYPFHNPIWSLQDIKSHQNTDELFIQLEEEIAYRNRYNTDFWIPSLVLEMDILALFIQIDSFIKLE